MRRLILVPQMPMRLRYSEWWPDALKDAMWGRHFDEIRILGDIRPRDDTPADFDISNHAIQFELEQAQEYMGMTLRPNDTLLLLDLSFCGIFPSVLTLKRPHRCFAFCHATSMNKYDLFAPIRHIKWPIERALMRVFDAVFVATQYHKNKLGINPHGSPKVIVTDGLPIPPPRLGWYEGSPFCKNEFTCCVSRPTIQKVTKKWEREFEIATECKVNRPTPQDLTSWFTYFDFVRRHKYMIITSKEETYGYQMMDAILNGTIPIAPDWCSYPELLPEDYLYSVTDEADRMHQFRNLPKWQTRLHGGCGAFWDTLGIEMRQA